jgi:hypothetical protein
MLKEMRAKTPHLFPFVIYLTGPIFVAFFQGKKIREITKGISIVSTSSLFASLVEEVVLEKVEQKCKCRSSPNHPSRHGKRCFIIASFCPHHVGVRIFPKNRFGSLLKIDLGRV